MIDLSNWHQLGRAIVAWLNGSVGLANLHALFSWASAFAAIWAMQSLTRGAGLRSPRAMALALLRVTLGSMALAFALAGLTPFITNDPPWLADLPIVASVAFVLVLITVICSRKVDRRRDMTTDRDALIECIQTALRQHGSPTVGRGSIHGGHTGYIVYEPSLPFIAEQIARNIEGYGKL